MTMILARSDVELRVARGTVFPGPKVVKREVNARSRGLVY